MKSETFFLDNEDDVKLFLSQCKKEGIEAKALPPKLEDGRTIYPVKVVYNFTNVAKED